MVLIPQRLASFHSSAALRCRYAEEAVLFVIFTKRCITCFRSIVSDLLFSLTSSCAAEIMCQEPAVPLCSPPVTETSPLPPVFTYFFLVDRIALREMVVAPRTYHIFRRGNSPWLCGPRCATNADPCPTMPKLAASMKIFKCVEQVRPAPQ